MGVLVGQGVKVSDAGVASGTPGVLDKMGDSTGVAVAIEGGVSSTGTVSVTGVGVTVSVEEGVGVVSRSQKNQ